MLIGWDVSTAAIGICVKDDAGKTLEFGVIYPKGDRHLDKHRSARDQVSEFCKRMLRNHEGEKIQHFVEERLGGFTGGLTTKQTLMVLAAMNAVVSLELSGHGSVTHIAPVTAKAVMKLKVPKGGDKKAEVIKRARAEEPDFPYSETPAGNWVRGTDDMADAWLLAEAGRRIISGEAKVGQPKKDRGRKRPARAAQADGSGEGGVRLHVPRKPGKRRLQQRPAGEGSPVGEPGPGQV